jgi:hypothetical protein
MPGYRLMELSNMQPHKPRGFVAAENVIGILDFLRELEEDPFPFAKYTKLQIVGLEEVLFAARPREAEVAADIHIRLNKAASDLEKRLLDIQVVFSGEIVRGADLTVKYRGMALPIHLIFNHPRREVDGGGNPFYPMEFHLSSP